ncbi:Uncharacterised protein [Chromobacterium vaccinii]|nr:Uncharacterised protein [Chromobacterium vaccinii]
MYALGRAVLILLFLAIPPCQAESPPLPPPPARWC